MPHGYFDAETVRALTALRERAMVHRREELLTDFPSALVAGKLKNTWRSTATRVYGNWLLYMQAQKARERCA